MQQEGNTMPLNAVSAKRFSLKLLIVVCDRKKNAKIVNCFKSSKAALNFLMLSKGTANSKILNYVGLGQTEKVVLWSIMASEEIRGVLSQLNAVMDLAKPGHGIAFTLPLDGVCVNKEVKDLDEEDEDDDKNGGNEVIHRYEHELILAVTNRGYTQEVMDAARAAKATGGTILHARGLGLSAVEKFFGVSIQPEKEIIMIVAPSERKDGIMRAIAEKAGKGTPASAVTFSLPVTNVLGLQPYLPEAAEAKPPVVE